MISDTIMPSNSDKYSNKYADRKILLVDDEPDIIEVIGDELKSHKIPFYSALNATKALELVEKHNPDVIVSDYKMPGLNGLDFFRSLRNLGNKAPVIWITGNADPETIRQAWEMGVYHVFQKPMRPIEVIREIEKALNMGPEDMVTHSPTYLTDIIRETHITKLQIDIDSSLIEKIKAQCVEQKTSINTFVVEAIRKQLK